MLSLPKGEPSQQTHEQDVHDAFGKNKATTAAWSWREPGPGGSLVQEGQWSRKDKGPGGTWLLFLLIHRQTWIFER